MVKLMLVVEVHDADTSDEAMRQLDDFRDAVMPSDHGLTIYRATYDDAGEFDLRDQRVVRSAFIKAIIES